MSERSLQTRLQEYCDCFVEADLEDELKRFAAGHREPVDADETEAALKMLAFSVLTAIERGAQKIVVNGRQISLLGGGGGVVATFPAPIVARAGEIIAQVSGMGKDKMEGRISLGLRGDEVPLVVRTTGVDGNREVTIRLPAF